MPKFLNVHPGELLREDFLKPMGVTPYRLAKDTKLPPQRINAIVNEQRGITPETDLRFFHQSRTDSANAAIAKTVHGVSATAVGYAGGRTENPSYEQVCAGATVQPALEDVDTQRPGAALTFRVPVAGSRS